MRDLNYFFIHIIAGEIGTAISVCKPPALAISAIVFSVVIIILTRNVSPNKKQKA